MIWLLFLGWLAIAMVVGPVFGRLLASRGSRAAMADGAASPVQSMQAEATALGKFPRP